MFEYILDLFFPPRKSEYSIRRLTPKDVEGLYTVRLIEHTQPATTALLPFKQTQVHSLIHECKYHGSRKAATLLAHALNTFIVEYLIEYGELSDPYFAYLPMPLTKHKHRQRGYNQIHRVLKGLPESTIPIKNEALKKIKETATQARLSREARLRNQKHAFIATDISAHTTYFLIDDVITTGATMQAAIDALRTAGAEHIVPIALAH